ncbi:DUF4435 domain-containing protein [Paenibacillus sp. SZ31]|uniref:DUF4435 domain-containing protein n=1 Tax=Paenibacillus sp. SZ31 TaxID=2725555 RepID=UPI00146E9306|nr:DUF4435 domain-containing protein [Paenibacillus sp. SZ31]NMI05449.1 DUF4435 domain-containing protein [Paenibacillus sp. SZ31]
MSSKIEKERAKRNNFSVHWAKFIKLYARFKDDPICFVEGEDIKYYGIRIERLIGTANFIESGGKKGVLKFFEKTKGIEEFIELKPFFFVDRDFDDSLNIQELYETPCYSIENFYTSNSVLERILLNEFKLTRADESFEKCMSLFHDRQAEYHDASLLLNVFIACQRYEERHSKESNNKLNLGEFKITDLFHLSMNRISAKYDLDSLYEYYNITAKIEDDLLTNKMREFSQMRMRERFRGKFEIEFLRWFLVKIISLAKEGDNEIFPSKIKVKLNITRVNFLSELSRFADECPLLKDYLSQRYSCLNVS